MTLRQQPLCIRMGRSLGHVQNRERCRHDNTGLQRNMVIDAVLWCQRREHTVQGAPRDCNDTAGDEGMMGRLSVFIPQRGCLLRNKV